MAAGESQSGKKKTTQEVDMGTLETIAVVTAVYAVVFLGNRASRALLRQPRT
jgi:hypothetical protein